MWETDHSAGDCRRVEMARSNILCLILFTTLMTVVWGLSLEELRIKRQAPTPEECMRPPMRRLARDCCKLPKERIWGDIKSSLNKCTPKTPEEQRPMAQQQMLGDNEAANSQNEGAEPVEDSTPKNGRRRSFGVRPHHFRRRVDDQCFMECVFEDQGFLFNRRVNKQALLERLHRTLGRNEKWHSVAVAAVETCHTPDTLEVSSNSTCQSGSEEMFRCIFKHIFFNCPTWPDRNQYCTSLKEYYQKCPEGPPPESEGAEITPTPETSEASAPEENTREGAEEGEEVTTTEEPHDE